MPVTWLASEPYSIVCLMRSDVVGPPREWGRDAGRVREKSGWRRARDVGARVLHSRLLGIGLKLLRTLVLATTNAGKVREFRQLLARLPVRVVGIDAIGVDLPPETGMTFAENAVLKATHAANTSGFLALADDSGLEVDLLGGKPGVRSARYAGEGAGDEANRQHLIQEVRQARLPGADLGDGFAARFRCAIALAQPHGPVEVVEGVCEGRVIPEPRGTGGFGYDPLFLLPDRGVTMAELAPEEKNAISHRARALDRALPILERMLAVGVPTTASRPSGGSRRPGG